MTNPVEPRPARARTRPSWIILGVFALLTLILTWPVVSFLGSRIPGTATWAFDESTFGWNIWYFKHALLDLHVSPLHTELIWYPLGIDLILYTFNFFNAIIALPLLLATNVPLASNVTVLLATILSGFGAYLLTLYVLRLTFDVSRLTPSDRTSNVKRQYAKCSPRSPPSSPASSTRSPRTARSMPRWATTTFRQPSGCRSMRSIC